MRITIPTKLSPLARAFTGAGAAVYAVGGLVRNTLMGLPPSDIDVCSRLRPEEAAALCEQAGLKWFDQGARFGTIAILLPGGEKVEHTTFRSESYGAGGAHRPESVRFGTRPEEDAFRRDFTVNALYADLSTGEVVDPTGGVEDLRSGRLRATSADADEIMGSDALRVLRLVRFAGELGFTIEPGTWAAAKRHAEGLRDISAERIREELDKILLCDARYGRGDVLTALKRLDELRAIDVFFAELKDGRGMPQRPEAHRYEVLEHAYHVCAEMPAERGLRLAGLLHDVGKPESKLTTGNFHAHDEIGAVMAEEMLKRLKYESAIVTRVPRIIARHMYDIQGTGKDATLRAAFVEWGRAGTADEICMREADVRGCGYDTAYVAERWRMLLGQMEGDGTPFSVRELAITGEDVLAAGVTAGKGVGDTLGRLWRHCIVRPEDNNRARLLKLLVNNRPEK